eukprot:4191377-Prymnesium_polylepis.2
MPMWTRAAASIRHVDATTPRVRLTCATTTRFAVWGGGTPHAWTTREEFHHGTACRRRAALRS